ncbi:hypothetical protein [Virgibacillus sp. DJP39]|uniref:hypothetical protein n=1 Tax=Virgibacillus sp. DJP39 TaxID=3409790 RepID=UPI003BB76654
MTNLENSLGDEFETKLNRALTNQEKEFLKWLEKKHLQETSLKNNTISQSKNRSV